MPSLPAASLTLSLSVLLPASVTPDQARLVPLTALLRSVQVAPLSSEPKTFSPAASGALRLPVMICEAAVVMKSVALLPVSLLSATPLKVVPGGVVS